MSQAYLMASNEYGVSAEWNHNGTDDQRAERYFNYLKDYIQKPLVSDKSLLMKNGKKLRSGISTGTNIFSSPKAPASFQPLVIL